MGSVSHMEQTTDWTAIKPDFIKALLAEDEVGCVIRTHLYIEAQIDSFLMLVVIDSKFRDTLDLTYRKKIELACSLGFDTQFRGTLKLIGKLRNDFAHNLSSTLTQQIVSDLFNSMPEFGRKAVHISVGLLHELCKVSNQPSCYDQLPPKMQFVLIALNLERICCSACDLIIKAKSM